LLSQIETRFGVPRQILVAIWGLAAYPVSELTNLFSDFQHFHFDGGAKSAL
jgi:hypothetical protein